VVSIFAGVNGYIDAFPVTSVVRFEAALLSEMRSKHADILTDIRNTKDLSDETKGKLKAALDAFVKTFA
ncbi:MAG: F0F1 ATP synthase subunit alpha, partial [Alphaproteobacteria bacterium]